ncbi:MAG: hypothetical protein ACO1RT_06175 [Planctomycetaceae bacterium]
MPWLCDINATGTCGLPEACSSAGSGPDRSSDEKSLEVELASPSPAPAPAPSPAAAAPVPVALATAGVVDSTLDQAALDGAEAMVETELLEVIGPEPGAAAGGAVVAQPRHADAVKARHS